MWSGEAIEIKLVNGLVRIFQAKKGRPSVNVGHFRLQVCLFWVQGSKQPREIRDSGSGWRLTWLSRTGLCGGSLFSDLSLSLFLSLHWELGAARDGQSPIKIQEWIPLGEGEDDGMATTIRKWP